MNLNDAKIGDLAIFSDGNQALIDNIYRTRLGRYSILFDRQVTGWSDAGKSRDWYYHEDGSFVVTGDISPHVDIVKVVHND